MAKVSITYGDAQSYRAVDKIHVYAISGLSTFSQLYPPDTAEVEIVLKPGEWKVTVYALDKAAVTVGDKVSALVTVPETNPMITVRIPVSIKIDV